jgi:hypothetical protein
MRCSQGDFVASPFREKPDMPRQICDEQQPSTYFYCMEQAMEI